MKDKSSQQILNKTYFTTYEFLNFKKEINERINNKKEETNNLDIKLDKVSDIISNIQAETNSKLELILQNLHKSNIKEESKENINKTEEECSSEEREDLENNTESKKNLSLIKRKKYKKKKSK